MSRKKKMSTTEAPVDNKIYFSQATEDAINAYNRSTDMHEREEIFRAGIAKPFDKLAENVINRFKFPYINQSFDDIKREVVSFLVINLPKFNPEKGSKAFSYFSVVAKNYLIYHNNVGYKAEKRNVYLNETGEDYISIEDMNLMEAPDPRLHEDTKEFVRLMVQFWDRNLAKVFKKKRDYEIASAVVELFRRADSIENFNKKALYLMIREMTDCKTNYITKVVNKMRGHIEQQLKDYYAHGTINPDDAEFFRYDD